MPLSAFLSLVEIRTKAASVLPFLIGTLYALYRFRTVRFLPLLLFFVSMLAFDMFTTGLNNRQDHRRARKREGFNFEKHNAITHFNLNARTVDATLAILFILAAATGIGLVFSTDWFVLLFGAAAFAAGLAYSSGPLPLSRTPLGEAASGIAMGFGIPFLSCYIHTSPGTLFTLEMNEYALKLALPFHPLLGLLLISAPCACCIANIMLANNLCDMEDDLENKRYTLPVVAGKSRGLLLFHLLYVGAFACLPAAVFFGTAPWPALLVLVAIPKVASNVSIFDKTQTKKDTFGLSVQNFLIISTLTAVSLGIGVLLS